MKMMQVQELVEELNYQTKYNESQSEDNIREMHHFVAGMFHDYCGIVPNFELDEKGRITILKPGY